MKKRLSTRLRIVFAATSALAALVATPAHADSFTYTGYLRAGPATSTTSPNGGSARQCYDLPGVDAGHYRIGNECDFYGEFGFNNYGSASNLKYHNEVMINEYSPGTDVGGSSAGFEQLYSSISGVDFAPNVRFWAGKRFYGRADIYTIDHKFVRMDGVGGGADNIDIGPGRLNLAYFGSDSYAGFGDAGTGVSTTSGRRFNFDYLNIPLNAGGSLRITGTYTKSNAVGGTAGEALSFQHSQKLAAIGGTNVFWLQIARGSASLAQNFGTATSPYGAQAWRVADGLNWQVGRFSGQAAFVYGHHAAGSNNDTIAYPNGLVAYRNSSIGAGFSYALTRNLSVIGQLGHMSKEPDANPVETLNIATVGLGLSPNSRKYYSRPLIRFYFTHASWNSAAANDPANANSYNSNNGLPGYGVSGASTSGNTIGIQVESWF